MAKKKTIMRSLKIDEISAVDRPAQGGAKKVLMKRAADEIFDEDLNTSITKTEDGKDFLPSDFAYVPDENESGTWKMRLTDAPGGEPVSKKVDAALKALSSGNRGYDIPSDARAEVVSNLRKAWQQLNPNKAETDMPEVINKSNPLNKGEVDMTKEELEKLQDDLKKSNAALEKANKLSEMTDAQKAKYNAMNEKDKADFLGKSAAEREEIMKNDADANPVVYKNDAGQEFRKNDDPRLVTMAKQSDEDRKVAKAATEKFEKAELEKRAVDVFKNSPGTPEEKGAMLKALEAIPDEALRKKAIESAKAGDAALAAAFTRKGAGGGNSNSEAGSAIDKLEELAKAYQKDHKGVTYEQAYAKVMESPEGSELYTQSIKQ